MTTRGRARTTPRPLPDDGWKEHAACRGEDLGLFFGSDGEHKKARQAREAKAAAVCADCPVRTECLDYAIAAPERRGVWGGLGEDERAAERRRRQRRKTAA